MACIASLLCGFTGLFRSRASLQIENLALRHQLGIYRRTCRRPRLQSGWTCPGFVESERLG